MQRYRTSFPRRQLGVTLVEALVALLVMALGLVSFAGLHTRLRLNSDISRQRAEAVRLAQEDMENLRAFSTIAQYGAIGASAPTKGTTALANTTTANATYTITRAVETFDTRIKNLRVEYAWTDRTGAQQTVVLRSTVAGIDPIYGASMSLAPNGSPVKDPLGRDVQIPIPAKDLGNGTSVYKPSQGGTVAFVFNNDTGYVTRKCLGVTPTTAQLTATGIASLCTDLAVPAYILSGFIRFSTSGGSPDPDNPNDAPPAGVIGVALALDQTTVDTAEAPYGTLNRLNTSYWSPTPPSGSAYTPPECGAEDSKTIIYTEQVNYSQVNNGSTQNVTSAKRVIIVPAGTPETAAGIQPYTSLTVAELGKISNIQNGGERYIGYACVVYPIDLNGAKAWTGRSTVTGLSLGNTSSTFKVCRYSNDADRDGSIWLPFSNSPSVTPANSPGLKMTKIDNAEHPNAYIWVTQGLSNQNFLVIKGNATCPTDGPVEINGQGQENYTDTTTVVHQS